MKPQNLGCWQQVVNALGEERAAVELQKVIDTPAALLDHNAKSVSVAFIWVNTPQGIDFWRYVEKGHYPDNTTKNEEKVTDEPVFGIVVRQYDIPEGCNVNVNHKEVTISFDGKYYHTKTEEGYDMVMQAIRLLAQAKNIERD